MKLLSKHYSCQPSFCNKKFVDKIPQKAISAFSQAIMFLKIYFLLNTAFFSLQLKLKMQQNTMKRSWLNLVKCCTTQNKNTFAISLCFLLHPCTDVKKETGLWNCSRLTKVLNSLIVQTDMSMFRQFLTRSFWDCNVVYVGWISLYTWR